MEQWPVAIQILTYVAAFNIALTGLKTGVDMIKDKTASQVDNKIADVLGKVCGLLSRLLDAIGFNPKHK